MTGITDSARSSAQAGVQKMFDLFGKNAGQRYGTGMWPMYYPRPWNMTPPVGIGAIVDPVAIASEVAIELRKIGWPGMSLMDQDFQMALLDAPSDRIEPMVSEWFDMHRMEIGAEFGLRLQHYSEISRFKTAQPAMTGAIKAYMDGDFLLTVRALMPEFESVARTLLADSAKKTSQSQVIKLLQTTMRTAPVMNQDPLESMSLFHFVDEKLFASCHTEADAASFGEVPNRHAELHGLDSYGNLQGASVVICAFDLTLNLLHTLIETKQITLST